MKRFILPGEGRELGRAVTVRQVGDGVQLTASHLGKHQVGGRRISPRSAHLTPDELSKGRIKRPHLAPFSEWPQVTGCKLLGMARARTTSELARMRENEASKGGCQAVTWETTSYQWRERTEPTGSSLPLEHVRLHVALACMHISTEQVPYVQSQRSNIRMNSPLRPHGRDQSIIVPSSRQERPLMLRMTTLEPSECQPTPSLSTSSRNVEPVAVSR